MTVRELIDVLSRFDQSLPVCYSHCSEYCLLEKDDLAVRKLGPARPDGWVPDTRPDKRDVEYLVLP